MKQENLFRPAVRRGRFVELRAETRVLRWRQLAEPRASGRSLAPGWKRRIDGFAVGSFALARQRPAPGGAALMQAYIARRLLALLPTLFFASIIVFVIVHLVPGSVIDLMLSQNDVSASKLNRDQLLAVLGLDRPMWEQYGRWIGGIVLHGDFGRSLWQSAPVADYLVARL